MTIINTSHRFIYVHIPKTAGTSVKHFLSQYTRYCDIEIGGSHDAEIIAPYYIKRFKLAKHSFAREIRDTVGRKDFKKFFKFAFVRNPFSRTASVYRFLKYNWRVWRDSAMMDEFSTLEEFATSPFFKGPGPDRILMPQMRWLADAKEELCVDYIGRVETLEHDLAEICEKLKLTETPPKLEKKNTSKADKDAEFTAKTVDAIRRRYVLDFDGLKYSRDPDSILESDDAPLGLLS